MATQIQIRRDTAADWNTADPTLAQGEIGLILGSSNEITGLKVGDGATRWEELKLALPMLSGVANILEESDSASGQPVGGTGEANDVTTFLLKGLSSQNAAVFGIEATGSTSLVLSIDKDGGITASGGVNVSGGYGGTGLTVGATGDVTTNGSILADDEVQSGTYHASGTTSGAQLVNSTDHGQLLISSTDAADLADVAIKVNTAEGGVADKFTVTHGGAIAMAGAITGNTAITSTGIVTCQGIVNSAAVINAGTQKITNVVDPTLAQDAATKTYVDSATGWQYLEKITSTSNSASYTFASDGTGASNIDYSDYSGFRFEWYRMDGVNAGDVYIQMLIGGSWATVHTAALRDDFDSENNSGYVELRGVFDTTAETPKWFTRHQEWGGSFSDGSSGITPSGSMLVTGARFNKNTRNFRGVFKLYGFKEGLPLIT
jgi:hypothetical protein